MAGSFCILNLHFCAFLFSHFCACCFKIPSASLEGIKNLEKPRKTLHTPKKKGKYPKKTCRNSVFVSSFNVFFACFACFAIFVAFVLHVFRIFLFCNFPVFFQLSQRSCLEMANLQKKVRKKSEQIEKPCKKVAIPRFRKICCKSNAKKMQMKSANPLQTSNLSQKNKSDMQIYFKKM